MIRPPKKIRIAVFDFEIVMWSNEYAEARGCFGACNTSKKTISIDETLDQYQMLDTFLHEVNHAIFWAYTILDKDKEERTVTMFATAWAQIFRDNPEVLRFIEQSSRDK